VTALAFCPSKILSQKAIYGQKPGQNTGLVGPKRHRPGFLKKIKSSIKNSVARFYINLRII
jgi:hypothetical protein